MYVLPQFFFFLEREKQHLVTTFLCRSSSWSGHHTQNKTQIPYQGIHIVHNLAPTPLCCLSCASVILGHFTVAMVASFLFLEHEDFLASRPLFLLGPLSGRLSQLSWQPQFHPSVLDSNSSISERPFFKQPPHVCLGVYLSLSPLSLSPPIPLCLFPSQHLLQVVIIFTVLLSAFPTRIKLHGSKLLLCFVYTLSLAKACCLGQSKPLINIVEYDE